MPTLLSFNYILIKIPRKRILESLRKERITNREFHRYKKLQLEIDKKYNQMLHLQSVLERVLNKFHT